MITQAIDYAFELDPETAAALRAEYGMSTSAISIRAQVVCLYDEPRGIWLPAVRRILINGVDREVPAEFEETGERTWRCSHAVAEAAGMAIGEELLTVLD